MPGRTNPVIEDEERKLSINSNFFNEFPNSFLSIGLFDIIIYNDCYNFNPDQNTEKHNHKFDRIPLVIKWHRHFAGFSKLPHDSDELKT